MWKPTIGSDELMHYAKGSHAKKHKYIAIKNGVYIYPNYNKTKMGTEKEAREELESVHNEAIKQEHQTSKNFYFHRGKAANAKKRAENLENEANELESLDKKNGNKANAYKIAMNRKKAEKEKKEAQIERGLMSGANRKAHNEGYSPYVGKGHSSYGIAGTSKHQLDRFNKNVQKTKNSAKQNKHGGKGVNLNTYKNKKIKDAETKKKIQKGAGIVARLLIGDSPAGHLLDTFSRASKATSIKANANEKKHLSKRKKRR